MKKTTRFLTIIGGLFRSVITILFLFASIFAGFVDKNLLAGFLDIVGFSKISLGFVKPLAIIVLIIGFFINLKVSRNIFLAGKTGEKSLANIFFAVLFIAIDLLVYLVVREKLIYILIFMNILVILSSILALIGKSKGLYGQTFKAKGPKKAKRKEIKTKDSQVENEQIVESDNKTNKLEKIDENTHYSLDFASDDLNKDTAKGNTLTDDSEAKKDEQIKDQIINDDKAPADTKTSDDVDKEDIIPQDQVTETILEEELEEKTPEDIEKAKKDK